MPAPPVMGPRKRRSATSGWFGVLASESLEQRGRQLVVLDGRHELGAGNLPEWRGRERVSPPSAPARECATVDADDFRQSLHPGVSHAVLHDRHQHHDGRQIKPAAEKAHRRRRLACAASIDGAAEAEATVVIGTEATDDGLRAATRLAREACGMQRTAAVLAAPSPAGIGKIAIDGEQQLVKSGIGQQGCVQGRRPPQRES